MRLFTVVMLCLLLGSCTEKKIERQVEFLEIDDFASYQSIGSVSEQLQTAASAVVRINYSGTGFFISADGKLMTNNHIISGRNCPASGCYIRVDQFFQSNVPYDKSNSKELFAKPLYTNVPFDFSVVQLFVGEDGEKFASPNYLEFESKTITELVGEELAIIGHPIAELKKVKIVTGFQTLYGYIQLSDYVFGGNSGSPIVSKNGKALGILHSGQDSTNSISRNGIQGWAAATASADILRLLGRDTVSISEVGVDKQSITDYFYDLEAEEYVFLSNPQLIIAAQKIPKSKPEIKGMIKTQILRSQSNCSKLIAGTLAEDQSPFAYNSYVRSRCLNQRRFINCQKAADYLYCPNASEMTAWEEVLQGAFDKYQNHFYSYNSSIVSFWRKLKGDKASKNKLERRLLLQFVDQERTELNFDLARKLIYAGLHDHKIEKFGVTAAEYVLSFRDHQFHGKFLDDIAISYFWLYADSVVDKEKLSSVIEYILSHRDLTAQDRFALESSAHRRGLLKAH